MVVGSDWKGGSDGLHPSPTATDELAVAPEEVEDLSERGEVEEGEY